jgi:hypothetical protein
MARSVTPRLTLLRKIRIGGNVARRTRAQLPPEPSALSPGQFAGDSRLDTLAVDASTVL